MMQQTLLVLCRLGGDSMRKLWLERMNREISLYLRRYFGCGRNF